jgi:hypothetical protein
MDLTTASHEQLSGTAAMSAAWSEATRFCERTCHGFLVFTGLAECLSDPFQALAAASEFNHVGGAIHRWMPNLATWCYLASYIVFISSDRRRHLGIPRESNQACLPHLDVLSLWIDGPHYSG